MSIFNTLENNNIVVSDQSIPTTNVNVFSIDFFELAFLVEECIPDEKAIFDDLDWRYIPGYDNYIINCFGDVISLERNIIRKNNYPQKIHSKYLEPCLNKKGYLFLRLSNLGNIKSIPVHKLVAMAFLGHVPNGMKEIIDHIDENKLNNYYLNLKITDNRRNVSKSIDKSKTTSKFLGVRFDSFRNKWIAGITIDNKLEFLGRFDDENDAHDAYQNKLKSINNGK